MTDIQRTERKQKDLTNGFIAQHVIYGRLKNHYNNIPRYLIEEAPAHSKTDMEDKIDISIIDTKSNQTLNIDVKSSLHKDKISYTHINSLGQKSKIYAGDFSIDLIFTLDDYSVGYVVKAKDFYDLLMKKLENGEEQISIRNPEKSRFIWVTLSEIKDLAINVI
jgi:hypothetical protein